MEKDTICAVSTPTGMGGIAVVRVSGPDAIRIVDSVWKGRRLADCQSHTAHLGTLYDPVSASVHKMGAVSVHDSVSVLDQCVATIFRAPNSFTGDDVVELSLHGSRYIQREAVNLLIRQGCRLAEPGEFTRRAFSSGKIDLAEAEGIADVIASTSRASHRVAISQMRGELSRQLEQLRSDLLELASLLELELDFSEEDVEFASRQRLSDIATKALSLTQSLCDSFSTGQSLREGVPVVILGKTNAGKSTLLNLLAGHDRAIVSDIHGTTRDTIDEIVEIDGIPFRIIDTAGLRMTDDPIEALGIRRTIAAASRATIILYMVDATQLTSTGPKGLQSALEEFHNLIPGDGVMEQAKVITLVNKVDILPKGYLSDSETFGIENENGAIEPDSSFLYPDSSFLYISALTGQGLDLLRKAIVQASGVTDVINGDQIMLTNHRHYEALLQATASLRAVLTGLTDSLSGDFIAQDLRQALFHIGSVTGGTITTPEILATIFSRFCVGK